MCEEITKYTKGWAQEWLFCESQQKKLAKKDIHEDQMMTNDEIAPLGWVTWVGNFLSAF